MLAISARRGLAFHHPQREGRWVPVVPKLFEGLDACVVSDALDSLGVPDRVADELSTCWEGGQVSGPVITVELATVTSAPDVVPVHLGARAITASRGGEVIVVDNGGRTEMGSWGGLLTRAAQQAGIAGVVSDGSVRDLDEARELRFPVFSRGGAVRTARGRIHEIATGGSISICGITVEPGDWVVADGSGVVFVPAAMATEVDRVARELTDREVGIVGRIEAGETLASVFGVDYEAMLEGQH
ncbi:RraA family protein [Gordonia terrae]